MRGNAKTEKAEETIMDFKKEIAALTDDMIALRRDFHRHPELGLHEVRTSQIVVDYLQNLGLEVRRCAGTGVIGVLKGAHPGKTVLMRCDMDALPVTEDTGLPFSSENPGVMHACGHDGHTAIHLTTARLIAQHREQLHGTVVFLFQLNEEDAGAELMIEDGALENPKPDAVCGFHLWSPVPTGSIAMIPGPIMASSWYFKLVIHGRGGHGGSPHKAINPIDAAAHVLEAFKTFHTLEQDATKPTVIAVCKIHAGQKDIIVPDDLEMEGSIRCLHNEDAQVRARIKELCEAVCKAYRCTCDIDFKCGNTLLDNNPHMTELAMQCAERVVGKENIITKDIAMMVGDDFAEFSRRVPGVYYFVGTGSEEAHSTFEHHSPHFTIDERSLPIAVQMEAEMIATYLHFDE